METKQADDKPTTRDVWMRGLYMLLFIIGFTIGQWLLNLLAIVQFLWLLVAREPNQFLARFGNTLSIWLADIGRFSPARRTTNHSRGNHGLTPAPWPLQQTPPVDQCRVILSDLNIASFAIRSRSEKAPRTGLSAQGKFCGPIALPSFDVTINSSASAPVGTNKSCLGTPDLDSP
jgi:hypothetical protein